MKASKYRELTKEKLVEKIAESKQKLFDLQFDVKIGLEKDFTGIRKIRKDIAKMNTILNQIK